MTYWPAMYAAVTSIDTRRCASTFSAAAARAAAAEKVEAQRRVSMLVTAAYIAGQYVIWFAFLKAASN